MPLACHVRPAEDAHTSCHNTATSYVLVPMSMETLSPDRTEIFEANRGRLWQIAYRMLGVRAEAEDVVQEAYLRWHRTPIAEIETPQAWLVTVVTRLAVDRLRQLRAERQLYTGPWLPEPLIGDTAPAADHATELASDLSVAFLAMLERLAPEERAAFLLHELFESDYSEIAQVLGKSEAACRQIVSRARKRVRAERPRIQVDRHAVTRLLHRFLQALHAYDKTAMLALLAEDATWTTDGGGKVRAALRVLQGAERVAKFAIGVARKFQADVEYRLVDVNGEPGFVLLRGGEVDSVMTVRTDGHRIMAVHVIRNPDKLRNVRFAATPVTTLPSASSGE